MSFKTTSFLTYEIYSDLLQKITFENRHVINTINPHSFMVAEKDSEFKNSLKNSDILLPDGVGITKAIHILSGLRIKRIAGMDIHDYLINAANEKSLRCFYLGSSSRTLDLISKKIFDEYSNVKVDTYSPPFKDDFSSEENKMILQKIRVFQPDILFVGMTAPKQEKWVYRNLDNIDVKIICSIGAVFDFFAGVKKRSSKFWINLGLEGFVRVYREPRRLWRRLIFSDFRFLFKILFLKVRLLLKF